MKKILMLFTAAVILFLMCSCTLKDILSDKIDGGGSNRGTTVITEEESHDAANAINICMYDFDTFNPLMTTSPSVRDAMKFVYEPLFTLDSSLNAIPVLADSYTVSDNGKSMTIALKENVVWHDGTSFSATDVVYTINKIINSETTYNSQLPEISGCKAINSASLEIYFSHGLPNAASLLTFPIVKNNTPMDSNAAYNPIGTGPFSYYGKIGVDRYMLVASDYYYKGKAALSGVYIDTVPDNERYFTMFDSGNSDVCSGVLIENFKYTPKSNMRTNEFVSNEMIYLGINNESAYLSQKNTRQALSCFIDKRVIEENVMYSSVCAVDVPLNPKSQYYCGNTTDKMFTDSVRGGELLEADGWLPQTKGYTKLIAGKWQSLKLRFLYNADSEKDVQIAQKIQENLNMNGIKVVMEPQPYDMFLERITARNFDIFLGTYSMNAALDVTSFLGNAANMFGYSNITIDMIMNQMGISRGEEDVRALFEQLRDVLAEDMPMIPIAYKKDKVYTSARIKNVSDIGADAFYKDLQNWSIR